MSRETRENPLLAWLDTPINQMVALSGMTLAVLTGIFDPDFNPREPQRPSTHYNHEEYKRRQTKYTPSRKYHNIIQP